MARYRDCEDVSLNPNQQEKVYFFFSQFWYVALELMTMPSRFYCICLYIDVIDNKKSVLEEKSC